MDIRKIQNFLLLAETGIPDKETQAEIDNTLNLLSPIDNWSLDRKLIAMEQLIYRHANIEVGRIDGLVGEQTRYAREVWAAKGDPKTATVHGAKAIDTWRDHEPPIQEPKASPVRNWPLEKDCLSFYGSPGTGHATLILPFPFRIAWKPEQTVIRVSVHSKCLPAFKNIWDRAVGHYGREEFRRLRLDIFGGCYNNRKKRGGSSLSMHAFACAWDIDPDRNQLRWNRKQATLDDAVYDPFWNIVEAQGGVSLGRKRDYDWMHFQFAR